MRNNLIYTLIGLPCLAITFAACSENWEDATSKHAYGANENPYLRADAAATVTESMKFGAGQTHTVVLANHAELFRKQLGMTIDEAIAGISTGKIVFRSINTARGAWDNTAPNKGTAGWYFDGTGSVANQATAQYTAELDVNAKTLLVSALESAVIGSSVGINVGFAINGSDYDKYVRILNDIVIVDTPVEASIRIPAGEYASAPVDFNAYANAIQERFGKTVAAFCAALSSDAIHMYSVGVESLRWDETSGYTANAPGYWMKADGTVCNWGSDGYTLYAECSEGDQAMYVGRSFAPAAGDTYTISIGFRDRADASKMLRFLIHIVME
jgi:hypothetical protein